MITARLQRQALILGAFYDQLDGNQTHNSPRTLTDEEVIAQQEAAAAAVSAEIRAQDAWERQEAEHEAHLTEWHAPYTYVLLRERWVKIGRTKSLGERIATLGEGSGGCVAPAPMDFAAPTTLIATLQGEEWETPLHQHFHAVQAAGEWYEAAAVLDELTELIRLGAEVTWWP